MSWFLPIARAAEPANPNSIDVCRSFFNFLHLPCAGAGGTAVNSSAFALIIRVINFFLAISASVALFMLVYAGLTMILAAAIPDKVATARKQITYSLLGLFAVSGAFLGTSLTRSFVAAAFGEDQIRWPSSIGGLAALGSNTWRAIATNYFSFTIEISSFVIVGVFIYAGYVYITGIDNADAKKKVKELIMWGLIGYLVVIFALTIVRVTLTLPFFSKSGQVDELAFSGSAHLPAGILKT